LSWVAAERGIGAAQRAEDPLLIGAGAYHLGHAFLRAGRADESVNVTERAASALMSRRHVGQSEQALVGGLSLTALLGAARANDAYGVREFLNRARTPVFPLSFRHLPLAPAAKNSARTGASTSAS